MPMFGQMTETLSSIEESISNEEDFFSVAITIPLVAVKVRCKACAQASSELL